MAEKKQTGVKCKVLGGAQFYQEGHVFTKGKSIWFSNWAEAEHYEKKKMVRIISSRPVPKPDPEPDPDPATSGGGGGGGS